MAFGAAALAVGLFAFRSARGHAAPLAPSASARAATFCPLQTPEEWQRFLERHARHAGWVQTCEDGPCDPDFYEFVEREVQAVFTACAGFLRLHEDIARCTGNLRRFIPSWMRQHDETSYGFNVGNHEYLGGQEAADKPAGMMTPPAAIVAALPQRTRVEEAARKNGLKWLTHDSAIEGVRTFVFTEDPQGRWDQWLLLNLEGGNKGGKGSAINSGMPVSVLAVQKKDAAGRRLPRVRLHFRDYTVEPSRPGYRLTLNETNNGKCYSCHTNGVRQLIARHTTITYAKPSRGEAGFDENGAAAPEDFGFKRLLEFNRRLRSYGTPDWDGKVTPEDFGPALGRAQGCIDCHDGKSRAVLNVSTSPVQATKKMRDELSMPYDTTLPQLLERHELGHPRLTADEERLLRQAQQTHRILDDEFQASRGPELARWFLESRCR